MRTRLALTLVAALALSGVLACAAVAGGATSGTVVAATVASASSLDASGCATNTAPTTFGTLLPGTSTVTSADCRVLFGSSNDTAMLRAYQTMASTGSPTSTAMYRPATGTLDATFGSGGKVLTTLGTTNDVNYATAVQPDGKLVTVGSSVQGANNEFALARYTASGALDPGFGSGGTVLTALGTTDIPYAMALQPDGKIIAAGTSKQGSANEFALARYTASGSLDAGFGSGGKVLTALGASDDRIRAVALQPDGKIVVAGTSKQGSAYEFALARYNADGSLDSTFGTGGIVLTAVGTSYDTVRAVAVQSDGKIVVAGLSKQGAPYEFALVRYNTDGSLDASFGSGGTVLTAFGSTDDQADAMVLQPDGRIVAAGSSVQGTPTEIALARYNADGTLDATFGSGGKVLTAVGSVNDSAYGVTLQPDGRIVVAGASQQGAANQFALLRYNANGSLDSTFGSGGEVLTALGTTNDTANDVTVEPDGRIVATGYSQQGAADQFALVQYGSTAVPDYVSGTTDWVAGSSMFGACLRAVASGASTDGTTWNASATCPSSNGIWWNAVPTTTTGGKVAASTTTGTLAAEADLRFGFRTATNQPPGTYEAPITFDVAAPNV